MTEHRTGQQVEPPFGRVLTAMVTPFDVAGGLDLDVAAELATFLVDEMGNDGLVVNGTTGESPTTTDAEKAEVVRVVVEAVGGRASVVAGVGTFDTAHTVELTQDAVKAGADGVLVVTPYYSKPPQAGVLAHFRAVADASDVPVLLYDIPHRTGTAIATDTLLRLAEHEQIVGVKDAKADLLASAQVLAETDLAYYSGDDGLTLPLLSVGAVGVIGTSTHFTGVQTQQLVRAYQAGDVAAALAIYRQVLPLYRGIFATSGVILVKAGLALTGRPVGGLRPPLVEATDHEIEHLRADFVAAGLASLLR